LAVIEPLMAPVDRLPLDGALRMSVQRTLHIPDDGGTWPLPPALGRLPVRLATDYGVSFAESARGGEHFLVPLHRQEAAWLQFTGRFTEPRAVMIGVGSINALSGLKWEERLQAAPQNYIVCPYQPWLDGFKVGPAIVRQFVAVPLHTGNSVEHQLTGRDTGGISIACFAPKAQEALPSPPQRGRAVGRELTLGAGGRIAQRVYPDPYGIDVWEPSPRRIVYLHILEAGEYERLTGEAAPPSPVDVQTYVRFGLPWFEVHDAARGDIPTSPTMSQLEPADLPKGETAGDATDKPSRPTLPVRPIPPRSRRRR
jgi:hypothetical protein